MKKKKYNFFKIAFYSLIIIYLAIYFTASNGYYEYNNHKKTSLTKEQIIKFENDIKAGKAVDINDYIIKDNYSYKTNLSTFFMHVSDGISGIVTSGVKYTFKWLSHFIDE